MSEYYHLLREGCHYEKKDGSAMNAIGHSRPLSKSTFFSCWPSIFSEVIIGTYSVSWLNEFSTIADQYHMAGISGLDSIHLVSCSGRQQTRYSARIIAPAEISSATARGGESKKKVIIEIDDSEGEPKSGSDVKVKVIVPSRQHT